MEDVRAGNVYDANKPHEGAQNVDDALLGREGNDALGEMAAAEDGGTEGGRDVRDPGDRSRSAGGQRNQGTGERRVPATRSRGSRPAGVHPAEAGARRDITLKENGDREWRRIDAEIEAYFAGSGEPEAGASGAEGAIARDQDESGSCSGADTPFLLPRPARRAL